MLGDMDDLTNDPFRRQDHHAIKDIISSRRDFRREPKMPRMKSRRRRCNWSPTSTSSATAAAPLIASSQG